MAMPLMLRDRGLVMRDFVEFIMAESISQIEKWGFQRHSAFEWLGILTEEVGELSRAISEYQYREGSFEDIIKEAIQVATLAIKIAVMVEKDSKIK